MTKRCETLPEFEVTVSIRNNRIKKLRLALGLSLKQAEQASGTSQWGAYERLAHPAMDSRDQWFKSAMAIADFLCVRPEELWPDSVKAVLQSKHVRELSGEDMSAYVGVGTTTMSLPPSELVEAQEYARDLPKKVAAAIDALSPRDAFVLTQRFGLDGSLPKSLAEVAAELDLTSSRVRQIEVKALRILKYRDARASNDLQEMHGVKVFSIISWRGLTLGRVGEASDGWRATLTFAGQKSRAAPTSFSSRLEAEAWVRDQDHDRHHEERLRRKVERALHRAKLSTEAAAEESLWRSLDGE